MLSIDFWSIATQRPGMYSVLYFLRSRYIPRVSKIIDIFLLSCCNAFILLLT